MDFSLLVLRELLGRLVCEEDDFSRGDLGGLGIPLDCTRPSYLDYVTRVYLPSQSLSILLATGASFVLSVWAIGEKCWSGVVYRRLE